MCDLLQYFTINITDSYSPPLYGTRINNIYQGCIAWDYEYFEHRYNGAIHGISNAYGRIACYISYYRHGYSLIGKSAVFYINGRPTG